MGDGGVGKTKMWQRMTTNKKSYSFDKDYIASVHPDYDRAQFRLNGKDVVVNFWDTMGQDKFEAKRLEYPRLGELVLIVYDVTQSESREHVYDWLNCIQQYCREHRLPLPPVAVVGNKIDKMDRANPIRLASLTNAYSGRIDSFLVSVKTGKDVYRPVEWLLSHYYSTTVKVERL